MTAESFQPQLREGARRKEPRTRILMGNTEIEASHPGTGEGRREGREGTLFLAEGEGQF